MERVRQLASHLYTPQGSEALHRKSPDDVVITLAVRSPLCKARKGGFKDARSVIPLLNIPHFNGIQQVISQSKIDPALVGDICVGTAYHARAASLAAGFPESVPVQCINRFCSSGLMAVTTIANQIRSGQIEVGLAVGVESMSENPDKGGPQQSELISENAASRDCSKPMGWTSENVAEEFVVTREEQDQFAALSFQRAEHAQKSGYFDKEIVPFTVYQKDPKIGERTPVFITKDDGIRPGTTTDKLAKIKSAFPQWGKATTTGGNASQITDGAAAVLMMTRKKAEELGYTILGKHVTTAVAGLPPRIMGIGPIYAIPMALKSCGITQDDVDLYEINEAFASQCVYVLRALGLSRYVATGLNELQRRQGKILVTSMCIGTGMGAAGVFVRD
ncbi:Thiolase, N-terminal domain-containing protein [Desarmillaria tabescens]|uniref:Thiolase, N-terminal domain-containing protein n=1 Tax=Armillaria tabescens TaxID=1929756 RepID=A0AA39NG35_ARMTA|nr:Thiolase, N-terminal domain-containing protein [Desarmillaria tabescens]KAK0464988.1 Thiolase, N-terminal domain-containing protein [Desarmillaria tabescens]